MRDSDARGSDPSPLSPKTSSSTLERSSEHSKALHEGLHREPPDSAPDPEIDILCPTCGVNTLPSYVWCGPCTAARKSEELPDGGADHSELVRDCDVEDRAFAEDLQYLGEHPV